MWRLISRSIPRRHSCHIHCGKNYTGQKTKPAPSFLLVLVINMMLIQKSFIRLSIWGKGNPQKSLSNFLPPIKNLSNYEGDTYVCMEGGEGLWAVGGFSNFWLALEPRNGFQSSPAKPGGNNQHLHCIWKVADKYSTVIKTQRQYSVTVVPFGIQPIPPHLIVVWDP